MTGRKVGSSRRNTRNRPLRGLAARALGVALVAVPGFGIGTPVLASEASVAEGEGGAGSEGGWALSLDRALTIALENNLDLVSARIDPAISEQGVVGADAGFDPTFTAGLSRSETEQEISNLFSLNESTSDGASAGVRQDLKFGADYSVTLNSSRNEQTGPLVTTPSSYNSTLVVDFNLPLLRGFGKEAATENLLLARNNLAISREDLRREAQRVIESVEGAYWDLAGAIEGLRLARLRLARAQDLLELNRKKVEVGTLAPIEITQAEAGVASQEEGVIVAEAALENAEDAMRQLLAIPQADPRWLERVEPTDRPAFVEVHPELDTAIATALAERSEMRNVRQTLDNRTLSERVARNRVLPGLDLNVNVRPSGNNFETTIDLGPDGIAGTPDDMTNTVTSGGLSESLTEIQDFDNFNVSAGLTFTYPIGNRGAKSNYRQAQLEREKAELAVANQEQAIRIEVRRAVRDIESSAKRVHAARVNETLQRKNLEAEEKKFENGMATSFEVLEAQNDLADAERSELEARLDYNKALAALDRVQGTLLDARGLSIR